LKLLDGKAPTLQEESQNDSEEEENHEEVLKLIASQWQEEKARVIQVEAANGSKKEFLKSTCITGGHAEIEDETILFIYGNSYDVVLANQNFQETV
jgi:leucine-rich repeat-containing protein 49